MTLSLSDAPKIAKLEKLLPVLSSSDGAYFEDGKLFAALRGKWFEIFLEDEFTAIGIGEIEGGKCTWVEVVELTPGFNCQAWTLNLMALRCLK